MKSYSLLFVLLTLSTIIGVYKLEKKVESAEYKYNVTIDLTDHKQWQYIEKNPLVINNNDSINITLNIQSRKPLDIVEIRFYNLCNNISEGKTGLIYSYVDERPAIPTIGVDINNFVYFATPKCPRYGTTITYLWDTNETRRSGTIDYYYRFEGDPITIKSIELYIVEDL